MAFKSRLLRLVRLHGVRCIDGPCPALYLGALVVTFPGPGPAVLPPEDEVPVCRTCGGRHLLVEELVVIEAAPAAAERP
jgi:hypothetical protein